MKTRAETIAYMTGYCWTRTSNPPYRRAATEQEISDLYPCSTAAIRTAFALGTADGIKGDPFKFELAAASLLP